MEVSFISLFQENSFGLWASLISMVCFGIADSFWKPPIYALGPVKTIFYRNLIVVPVVWIILYAVEGKFKISWNDPVKYALIISAFSYLGLYFFSKAQEKGQISVVVPVSSLNTMITMLVSIITLQGAINNISLIGIIIALLGMILIKPSNTGKDWMQSQTGFRFALICAVFWGYSYAYNYLVVTFTGIFLFSVILETSILVLSGLHLLVSRQSLASHIDVKSTSFKGLLIIGFFGAIGTTAMNIGLDKAAINTVCGIVSLAPIISVAIGVLYYKERLSLKQGIAIMLIFSGIFTIAYFRHY